MKINEKISKARKDAGLTQQALADAVSVTKGAVSQWEKGTSHPRENKLIEIARATNNSLEWFMLDGMEPYQSHATSTQANGTRPPVMDVRPANVPIPNRFDMPLDVPVMGTAAANHEHGAFQLETAIVDYVRRPSGIASAKDVYALYVEGDSMEPRFFAGDLVFVNPSRPVRIGDAIVVQFVKQENDSPQAMIGVLHKRANGEVFLQKYNPAAIITLKADTVQSMHRIMANNELYGV